MITIRPAKQSDLNYVASGFKNSVRGQVPYKFMSPIAKIKLDSRIDRLVFGESTVTIAADQKDDDVIVGWAVHDPGVLHFLWVKYTLRRNGFGTKLFRNIFPDAPPLHSTHTNFIVYARLDKRWGLYHYDPYLTEDLLFPDTLKFDTEAVNAKLYNK